MTVNTPDRLRYYLTRVAEQIVERERDRLDREPMTAAERDDRLAKLRDQVGTWQAAAEPAALRMAPAAQGRI